MIQRITAISNHKINGKKCKCYGTTSSWDRNTIGNIIENIPKLIKNDGWWKKVIIIRQG